MISLKLPKDLEDRLDNLVIITSKSKSFFMREALTKYLQENENTFIALAKLEQSMSAAPIDNDENELRDRQISSDASTDNLIVKHAVAESWKSQVRILLAEDSPINRIVTIVMLKKLGYQVDAVKNGAEAVNVLENMQYDLVLMDCQMPKMDGYEATMLIRKDDSHVLNHGIPIVAITAHATKEDREKCIKAGMNEHIAKPLQPKEIEEVLARILGGKAAAGKTESISVTEGPVVAHNQEEIKEVFNEMALIERFMGDRDLCREILALFLDDIQKEMGSLREHLNTRDALGIARQAHTIKGAAANVEAGAIRAVAYEIENAGKRVDLDHAFELFARLEEQFELFETILNQTGWIQDSKIN
ncbi:MAG: response regulator [Proteobacteria bacterium]|nr:response regulator [Pseudomonadota bacterium]